MQNRRRSIEEDDKKNLRTRKIFMHLMPRDRKTFRYYKKDERGHTWGETRNGANRGKTPGILSFFTRNLASAVVLWPYFPRQLRRSVSSHDSWPRIACSLERCAPFKHRFTEIILSLGRIYGLVYYYDKSGSICDSMCLGTEW